MEYWAKIYVCLSDNVCMTTWKISKNPIINRILVCMFTQWHLSTQECGSIWKHISGIKLNNFHHFCWSLPQTETWYQTHVPLFGLLVINQSLHFSSEYGRASVWPMMQRGALTFTRPVCPVSSHSFIQRGDNGACSSRPVKGITVKCFPVGPRESVATDPIISPPVMFNVFCRAMCLSLTHIVYYGMNLGFRLQKNLPKILLPLRLQCREPSWCTKTLNNLIMDRSRLCRILYTEDVYWISPLEGAVWQLQEERCKLLASPAVMFAFLLLFSADVRVRPSVDL